MKFPIALSTILAFANAAATPQPASKDTSKIEIIPVPEGFFESHLGETGISLIPADNLALAARAITHVYMCINDNFQPACENFQVNTGVCYNLGGNWNDAISSIGPDSGTTCTIWYDNGCSGRSVSGIVNPGIYNLNDWNFNDVASSVKCV
ncbi:hypothetical protein EG329_012829 [Mollisiaceae sp. DMI_Dod_QoI]|nr:hypothetical protein EG329_012829 [Helotiales sp. DMI_Dod_QoI]